MFLRYLEVFVGVVFVLLLVTQVVWPLARGRTVFPLFRRQGKLEAKLSELRTRQDEDELEAEIKSMKPEPETPESKSSLKPKTRRGKRNA